MTSSPSSVVDPTVVVPPGPLDDQPRTTRTRDCPTPGTALMGCLGHDMMVFWGYPLVNIQKAIENGHV